MAFSVIANGLSLSGKDASGVDWMVEKVDGWGATASTASQTQRARASGAWSGDKFARPRAVAVEGQFTAPSPAAAQVALDLLLASVTRADFVLSITEASTVRWATVYQTGEVIVTWRSPTFVTWSFQVASDDWRKFGSLVSGTTPLPSEAGGLTIPFTIPFTVPATSLTGQVSLTNPGNEAGPVTLRVDGPCTGPVITHRGTGATLTFASSLVLNDGEFLLIDMEARTVLANGQASRAGWITSRGWSTFLPGPNTWSFAAAAYTAEARLTVSALPAWR